MRNSKLETGNRVKLHVKKGDTVKVISGGYKGVTGKVLAAVPKKNGILIEDLNIVKRHVKPSQANPRGGTKDVHVAIDVSKVRFVKSEAKKASGKGGKK